MPRLLIANPWASGVDEDRLAGVREALPADTELRLTSARGEATEIAREVCRPGRRALRLRRRRNVQRGAERHRRDDAARAHPGRRHERAPACARASARAVPRRPSASPGARDPATDRARARRTDAASASRAASASTPRSCARSTSSADARTVGVRANVVFAWTGIRTLARAPLSARARARGRRARAGGLRARLQRAPVQLRGTDSPCTRRRARRSRAASTSSRRCRCERATSRGSPATPSVGAIARRARDLVYAARRRPHRDRVRPPARAAGRRRGPGRRRAGASSRPSATP